MQATLYKMAQQIVAENPYVESVTYSLPNKHYIPVDMRYIGVDNMTPLSGFLCCCCFYIVVAHDASTGVPSITPGAASGICRGRERARVRTCGQRR